jgi:outer membrane protein OmpA-like peptidoglycan-associated protein
MKKVLLITFISLETCLSAFAQTAEHPWSVGLFGLKNEYYGDLTYYKKPGTHGNKYTSHDNTFLNFDPIFGGGAISIDRYINDYFTAGLLLSGGTYGYHQNLHNDQWRDGGIVNPENGHISGGWRALNSILANAELNVKYKFLGIDYAFRPYLLGGINYLNYFDIKEHNPEGISNSSNHKGAVGVSLGIGFDIPLTERMNIRYEYQATGICSDKTDLYRNHKTIDFQGQHLVGIVYALGKAKSEDPEAKAQKKAEKEAAKEAKLAEKRKEKAAEETINNTTEEPVNTSSNITETNISQATEQEFETPTTNPEPALYIEPETSSLPVVTATINDEEPERIRVAKKYFRTHQQDIQFETGKAILKNSSYRILDSIVFHLERNGDYFVTVDGYTDNVGNDQNNLELSKQRAAAVKEYLVRRGIQSDRLQSRGYGEQNPVADNNTATGRAQNRRVEVKFTEKIETFR